VNELYAIPPLILKRLMPIFIKEVRAMGKNFDAYIALDKKGLENKYVTL